MKAALNSQINPSQYPYRPYVTSSNRLETGGLLSPPMQIPTPHRLVFDSPMLLNDESERQIISNEGPLSMNIPDRP